MALGKILQILTNGSPKQWLGPQPPSQAFHSALQRHLLEQQKTAKDRQADEESLETKRNTPNWGEGNNAGGTSNYYYI